MQNYWNSVKSASLSFADKLTPVLKESKFKETGNITPEEFVAAGDFLIEISPSWKWSAGDAAERKIFLPDDKQFLITRRVPCYKRCKEIEYDGSHESIIRLEGESQICGADGDHAQNSSSSKSNNDDDAWVDTHATNDLRPAGSHLEQGMDAMELKDDTQPEEDAEEDSEECLDLEDIDDDMVMTVEKNEVLENQEESNIMKTRTYDLLGRLEKNFWKPYSVNRASKGRQKGVKRAPRGRQE